MTDGEKKESSIVEKVVKTHDDVENLRKTRPRLFWKLMALGLVLLLLWKGEDLYFKLADKKPSRDTPPVVVNNTVNGKGVAGGTVYGDVNFNDTTTVSNVTNLHQTQSSVTSTTRIERVISIIIQKGFSEREVRDVHSALKEHFETSQIEELLPTIFVPKTPPREIIVTVPKKEGSKATSSGTLMLIPLKEDGWCLSGRSRDVRRIGKFTDPELINVFSNLPSTTFYCHVVGTNQTFRKHAVFYWFINTLSSEKEAMEALRENPQVSVRDFWNTKRTNSFCQVSPTSNRHRQNLVKDARYFNPMSGSENFPLGDILPNRPINLAFESAPLPQGELVLNIFMRTPAKWLAAEPDSKLLIIAKK